MRVLITGSRNWTDRARIADRLFDLALIAEETSAWWPFVTLVHGDAPGADTIAKQEGEKLGFLTEPHNYRKFISPTCSPKRAPLERNTHMVNLGADLCIAFWKDNSSGTADTVNKARAAGIPVEEIHA